MLSKKSLELQSRAKFTIWGLLAFFLPPQLFLVIIVFDFLVCSEDADSLRIHTLSATGDIESIQKMVDDLDIEQGPSSSS